MEPNEVERRLRQEWWAGHGCPLHALYGDDGEMQCNASTCRKDFKREPLGQLWAHVRQRRLLKFADPPVAATPAEEHFWTALANGWDIEPREYFEKEAVAMGFKSPIEMAVHWMWKRHAKDWPNAELAAKHSKHPDIKRVQQHLSAVEGSPNWADLAEILDWYKRDVALLLAERKGLQERIIFTADYESLKLRVSAPLSPDAQEKSK